MHIQDIEPEPEQDQLAVVVASSPLEKTKAQQLKEMFVPYLDKMSDIEKKIKLLNADTPGKEDIAIAKQIRLALKNNRVAAEKTKDDSKAAILIEGRLIDSLFGVINNTSKGLELQLSNIEKAAEIAEANRKKELASNRAEQLSMYEIDLTGYDLGAMADNTFAMLLENTKAGHEKRLEDKRIAEENAIKEEAARHLHYDRVSEITKYRKYAPEEVLKSTALNEYSDDQWQYILQECWNKEAAEKLHEERIKELKPYWIILHKDFSTDDLSIHTNDEWAMAISFYAAKQSEIDKEQLRIKEENERLKKEAEEKETQQRAERERIAEEKRMAQEKADAELKAEREKLAAAEQEKQKLAAELQAKQDAIEKQQREIAAAAKKAERAPDKEKLQGLANDLRNYSLPTVKSTEAAAIVKAAQELLIKTADYIQGKINEL